MLYLISKVEKNAITLELKKNKAEKFLFSSLIKQKFDQLFLTYLLSQNI